MYAKVHKKGNQWFRVDNGTLVGTEISHKNSRYKYLSSMIGECILVDTIDNRMIQVYCGHLNNRGKLIRSDNSKIFSDNTYGFYVFVLV